MGRSGKASFKRQHLGSNVAGESMLGGDPKGESRLSKEQL